MHRKKPYSGKQKKQQLKDKKLKKKDGPNYLADDSDDEERVKKSKVHHVGGVAAAPTGFVGQLEVLRVHEQPRKDEKTKLDTNSFRLHFLKESDEELDKRKREARKPLVRLDEKHLEYKMEDVFPPEANLDFPKRPLWNYRLSKEGLEQQEREYFKSYVTEILKQPRAQDLSYFEVNLETWRQLWRVLEISDILLIIADIRYPVMHIPPSLVSHIQTQLHKSVVIILNKVDFVPTVLALSWKHYLQETFPGIHVVFFSSYPRESHPQDDPVNFDTSAGLYKRPYKGKRVLPVGPSQLLSVIKEIVQGKADLSLWEKKIAFDASPGGEDEGLLVEEAGGKQDDDSTGEHEEQNYTKYKDGIVTVGCIGYPNVGKSSVMNVLVGKKVVSVSKTPGHTKHLQTIFLCPTVRLCDCPGLVFPSMVPRSLQVIAGVFPVAQVKEPYSVVGYLAQRLDLPRMLKITPPEQYSQDESKNYEWTAFDICEAWAIKSGFTTARAGRPDTYRAANKILRLAVEGQLCLCFRPPNYSANSKHLLSDPEADHLATLFSSHSGQKPPDEQEEDDQEDDDEDDSEEEEDVEVTRTGSKAGIFARLQELNVNEDLS